MQSLGGPQHAASEFDVAPRPWVPHSGWPISHAELARHYPRAAEMLRLPGRQWFAIGAHQKRMSDDEHRLLDDDRLTPTVSLWAPAPMRFGGVSAGAGAGDARARSHQRESHAHTPQRGRRPGRGAQRRDAERAALHGARAPLCSPAGLENARLSSPRATASRRALAIASIRWGATSWNIRAPCSARCGCGRAAGCPCCAASL